ncbi:hypothetical protein ACKE5C_19135 (plasmid) [Aneurinibacillus thermoaerophilus]|uniref:Uncharacterized protein n=1 Tax=Aneurinibacillus thermoaerophilus TaxID=143495 RepID=A0ABX8YG32_ANETH|nr:hypothetical protein [Aneurinibacillus thermoaerophilus]QYY44778.1 hypothetical protein K3F53_18765 [Aneurinibacillus thermoaerophilus]
MLLEKIKSDLQKMFSEHGKIAFLIEESKPIKNNLGEIIAYKTEKPKQVIIQRNLTHQVLSEMAGDVSTGNMELLLPTNTRIVETSLIEYQGRRYQIKTVTPKRIFGEIVCYQAAAERVDGNVEPE